MCGDSLPGISKSAPSFHQFPLTRAALRFRSYSICSLLTVSQAPQIPTPRKRQSSPPTKKNGKMCKIWPLVTNPSSQTLLRAWQYYRGKFRDLPTLHYRCRTDGGGGRSGSSSRRWWRRRRRRWRWQQCHRCQLGGGRRCIGGQRSRCRSGQQHRPQ